MANNVEWAYVDSASTPLLLGPYDEAGDGETPSGGKSGDGDQSSTVHGIGIEEVVIYGEPEQLRNFLLAAADAVTRKIIEMGKQ